MCCQKPFHNLGLRFDIRGTIPHIDHPVQAYQVGFEFCDGANERQEESPHWTTGIYVFSPGDENDAQTVELVHDLQEVLHASRDPVERSHEHDRKFLPSRIRDERVEPRTSGSTS